MASNIRRSLPDVASMKSCSALRDLAASSFSSASSSFSSSCCQGRADNACHVIGCFCSNQTITRLRR